MPERHPLEGAEIATGPNRRFRAVLDVHDAATPHIRVSGQRAADGVQHSYRGAMTHEHSSGCPAMPGAETSPA